jgi:signal transduction histidine kinase
VLSISHDREQTQIVVGDNGKGISPDDLPHIFERMYQCDNSRSGKGNGLGLSITKELVNAHKGIISVASTPGSGTMFTILFPKTP